MITIVLIDDYKSLRQGVKSLLEEEPDIAVVGETGNGLEGIRLVESLKPDLVISDLAMEELDGIEILREVRRRSPKTKTIILSMSDDAGYVSRALREGAMGYVVKGSIIDELEAAIRQVAGGSRYVSAGLRYDDPDTVRGC